MNEISQIYSAMARFSADADSWMATFVTLAKAIGFIAITVIWGVDLSKALSTGTPINFTRYLYPLALSALLGVYPTFEKMLMNSSNSMEKKMLGSTGIELGQAYKIISMSDEDRYSKMHDIYRTAYEKQSGRVWSQEASKYDPVAAQALDMQNKMELAAANSSWFDSINPVVWINKLFKWIAVSIGAVAYFILMLIAMFRLKILGIIGPLAIGISIIPAYSNSAANFFHKAVSYILWAPLAAMINSAVAGILIKLNDSDNNAAIVLAVCLFQVVLYFQIPKVAHEIMMIGGGRQGSGVGQAVTNTVVSTVTKGLK